MFAPLALREFLIPQPHTGIPGIGYGIHTSHMAANRAAAPSEVAASHSYEQYVNPQWVALLNLLDMNVEYDQCLGWALFTKDGRRTLDSLSGYCAHNAGHNHPHIVSELKQELSTNDPVGIDAVRNCGGCPWPWPAQRHRI